MSKGNFRDRRDHALGVGSNITRRDFLNAALIGTGATLLDAAAPIQLIAEGAEGWNGYSGIGDYALSNGNTAEVVRTAHSVRDGRFNSLPADAVDTGETYDLAIVGGGFAGLAAAYEFKRTCKPGQSCLIVENHPIFGGEAKRNEFEVNGFRLAGPQGSNTFAVPDKGMLRAEPSYDLWDELGIPRKFDYRPWPRELKRLDFSRDNYGFLWWADRSPSIGWFFDEGSHGMPSRWVSNMFEKQMEGTPYSAAIRKDFLTWRNSNETYSHGSDYERWLDSMTYKNYIEQIMGLSPTITGYADPIVAASIGLGCDVTSAYAAYSIGMPGFKGFQSGFKQFEAEGEPEYPMRLEEMNFESFPGGNDGLARYFVKWLTPDSIEGERTLSDVIGGAVNFQAIDRPGNPVRMRLASTVVYVAHDGPPAKAPTVTVAYVRKGHVEKVHARSVVMASGNWIARYVVRDLPENYREAAKQFHRSPMLVVNVAVKNWRFLYKLGFTACRWLDGFGFSCNIRRPMVAGKMNQPFDPEKPIVITFYVPFYYPGRDIAEQGEMGRSELLSASYAEYERRVREQMTRLFSKSGFDSKRDIAGIILNRWGHAYVDPQPGFYYGVNGRPAPSAILRERYGRIAIGHSELRGFQNWIGAVAEGRRAAKQAMAVL